MMEQRPFVLMFAGGLSGMAAVWNQTIPAAVFFIVLIMIGILFLMRKNIRYWPALVGVLTGLFLLFIKTEDIHRDLKKGEQKTILQAKVCRVSKTEKSQVCLLKKNGLEGKILLYYTGDLTVLPGDVIEVKEQTQVWEAPTNPGQFSSENYYFSKGIYYKAYAKELKIITHDRKGLLFYQHLLRTSLQKKIEKQYQRETEALVKGMLLGDKSNLSTEVKDDFKESGLIHLLAVSGLHISLAGRGLYRLLRKIGIGFSGASVAGFLTAGAYVMLTGASVSSVRAILMLGVYFLSQILGKCYDLLSSAAFAGIIILLYSPVAFLDSGFLLSFCAVFVIGWMGEQKRKKKRGILAKIIKMFSFPIEIQLGMLPLVFYLQYETPVFSFLANAVAVPLASLAFTIALFCVWMPPCLIHQGTGMLFQIILWISRQEYGTITTGHVPFSWVLLFYILLYFILKKKFFKPIYATITVLGLWALVGVVMFRKSSLAFLDIGQGDCTAIRLHAGMILIDGGSSSVKNVGRYRILPYLRYHGLQKVKIAIITHMDEDHYSGILELIEMKRILYLGLPELEKDGAYQKIEKTAKEAGTKIFYLSRGKNISAVGMDLTVLHPKKGSTLEKNAASLVFQGKVLGKRVLITGDVEKEGETQLLTEGLEPVDLLKASHHGSNNATNDAFLLKTKPLEAVISCGKNNRYGHPHRDVLSRLQKYHTKIYRTDQQGAVIFQ